MASVPVKGYCVKLVWGRTHRPSVPTQGYSSHETCQHLLFEEDGVVAYRVLQDPQLILRFTRDAVSI